MTVDSTGPGNSLLRFDWQEMVLSEPKQPVFMLHHLTLCDRVSRDKALL